MRTDAQTNVRDAVRTALEVVEATDAVWLQRSVLNDDRAPPRHRHAGTRRRVGQRPVLHGRPRGRRGRVSQRRRDRRDQTREITMDATDAHPLAGPEPVVVDVCPGEAIVLRRRDIKRELGLL